MIAQARASTAATPADYVRSASGGTSSRPDRRVTGPKRIRRDNTPETTRKQAPVHPVGVRKQAPFGELRFDAREHSGLVVMQRQLGMAWWLTFPHQGANPPFRSEREMRTLAKGLDLIIAGRIVSAADLLM